MEDSFIIWKFLTIEYPNDHQAIYLYVCGGRRSETLVIGEVMKLTKKIFEPSFNEHLIKVVVVGYLEDLKKQFLRGEFKPKQIYIH